MAAVLDPAERPVDQIRVRADRQQRERLLAFAARFEPRCWAVEGAAGVGALAKYLVLAPRSSHPGEGLAGEARRSR
jgi:hypothetical protein